MGTARTERNTGNRLNQSINEATASGAPARYGRPTISRLSWHCHVHGKQVGPLTAEEWSHLVSKRLLTAETLVWKEGMEEWRPLGEIAGLPVPNIPPDHRLHPCNECGRLQLDEDLLRLGAAWVCSRCKPTHLQRLREGAPPANPDPTAGIFASGKYLIVRAGAIPSPHCMLCNQPATWRKRQSYSWHPNWLLLTLMGTPLALVIAAMVFSRAIQLELVLCDEHQRARQRRILLAGAWIIIGLLVLLGVIFGGSQGLPILAAMCLELSGLISLLMGPLYAQRVTSVLIARRITKDVAVFRGAHASYLANLPPWTGDPP